VKVGDLVRNQRGDTGIVVGLDYTDSQSIYDLNLCGPFMVVATPQGKRIWSAQAMEVVSESR
jgi:hypothetical protein